MISSRPNRVFIASFRLRNNNKIIIIIVIIAIHYHSEIDPQAEL